jgi:hypothetical protein
MARRGVDAWPMLGQFFGFERSHQVALSLTISAKRLVNTGDLQLNATRHYWAKSKLANFGSEGCRFKSCRTHHLFSRVSAV